ncbi:hypothetical protein F5Y05DRAFT_421213 [Hypoxylon sp. FL0543]|nr:hypothetical protein F5Y05DRAFT_421213 [Hypoxylon sp. FL0543]
MFPDSFVGCYAQYKKDTSVFTTWLGHAAQACGYEPKPAPGAEAVPPQRLKGKARKAAQKAAKQDDEFGKQKGKYTVTTEELLVQAQTVDRHQANIRMPPAIKESLQRAIEVRQRCANWNKEADQNSQDPNQKGHRYFIKVLEDILKMLGTVIKEPEAVEESKPRKKLTKEDKAQIELRNRFSHLSVEDVDESFELTAAQVASASTKTKNDPQPRPADIFELEAEKEFEDSFAAFCFFQDLHKIEERLKQTWKDFKSGQINLVVADIITRAAICMIRRAEEDICSSRFADETHGDTYFRLYDAMSTTRSLMDNPGLQELRIPNLISFDNFGFLPTAFILEKFSQAAMYTFDMGEPLVTPIDFLHLLEPQRRGVAECQRLAHQDRILSQLLIGMRTVDLLKASRINTSRPTLSAPIQEDIFTTVVRPVWEKKTISATCVVTSKIILDILEINGYEPEIYERLMGFREHAGESFQFKMNNGVLTGGKLQWPGWTHLILGGIYETLGLLERSGPGQLIQTPWEAGPLTYENASSLMRNIIEDDCLMKGQAPGSPEHLKRMILAQKLDFIEPSADKNFPILQNSLYMGALAFKLATQYEEVGIAVANKHKSVFACAHIYNALRQLDHLNIQWPTMDRIIKLHMKPIFADTPPTTFKDIKTRIVLRLSNMTKGEFKFPWSAAFVSLLDEKATPAKALWPLEEQIEALENEAGPKGPAAKRAPGSRKARKIVTPDSFLKGLRAHVPRMVDEASIDYVRLTKRCNRLLAEIFQLLIQEMEANDGGSTETYKLLKPNNPFYSVLILELFRGSLVDVEKHRKILKGASVKGKPTSPGAAALAELRHGWFMPPARKVFEKFLKEEEIDYTVPMMRACGPRTVVDEDAGGDVGGESPEEMTETPDDVAKKLQEVREMMKKQFMELKSKFSGPKFSGQKIPKGILQ